MQPSEYQVRGNDLIVNFRLRKDVGTMMMLPCPFYDGRGVSWNDSNKEDLKKHLKYHDSWDWLLPVVKDIKDLALDEDKPIDIFFKLNARLLFVDIDGVYESVVEFLEWLNTRVKK